MKKLLFDFFPIVLFFLVYKMPEQFAWLQVSPLTDAEPLILATAILIPATLLQVVWSYIARRKIEKMHLVTLALVIVMGGATVLFKNPEFIKWKVTVANWLFALVFLGSEFIGKKNVIERMMGAQLELPATIWTRLNLMWVGFFFICGVLNLIVAFSGYFTEEQWVDFKLFGMLGLTLVFVVLQGIYLSRQMDAIDLANSQNKE